MDLTAEDVIDEGRFAGGVIADEEDKGEGGAAVGVFGERAAEVGVEWHYGGVECGAFLEDALLGGEIFGGVVVIVIVVILEPAVLVVVALFVVLVVIVWRWCWRVCFGPIPCG